MALINYTTEHLLSGQISRWTPTAKEVAIIMLRQGKIPRHSFCLNNNISPDELLEWERQYDLRGSKKDFRVSTAKQRQYAAQSRARRNLGRTRKTDAS